MQQSPEQRPDFTSLHEWFARVPGSLIVDAEVDELNRMLPDLFGYHLLQVGRLGEADLMAQSRILHRHEVRIDDSTVCAPRYSTVRGLARSLPIESHSVDVLILPHVLEFEDDPHAALREVFRVLVPEGHLIIFGFNPWSLLGFWRLVLRRRAVMPWRGSFLGHNRIKDWLALLGFDVLSKSSVFFRPPFRNERILSRLRCLDAAGRKAPYLSGAYMLVARKRVSTLTPIRPVWRPRRRLAEVGLVRPSVRAANGE